MMQQLYDTDLIEMAYWQGFLTPAQRINMLNAFGDEGTRIWVRLERDYKERIIYMEFTTSTGKSLEGYSR